MTASYETSDKELMIGIGERIRAERLRRNLLIEDLAERCAMSRNTLSKIESGGSTTMANLLAVLRELRLLEPIFQLAAPAQIGPMDLVNMRGLGKNKATSHGRVRASTKKAAGDKLKNPTLAAKQRGDKW